MAEKHVRVEQDMYMDYEAVVRCPVGVTGVQGGGATPPVLCSHYRSQCHLHGLWCLQMCVNERDRSDVIGRRDQEDGAF